MSKYAERETAARIAEDEWLKGLPVQTRIPCAGCVHLKPTAYPEYAECTFVAPVLAYWQYSREPPSNWRNTKYMNGPFTDDVVDIECAAKQEG